jgi:hypothetical protein
MRPSDNDVIAGDERSGDGSGGGAAAAGVASMPPPMINVMDAAVTVRPSFDDGRRMSSLPLDPACANYLAPAEPPPGPSSTE